MELLLFFAEKVFDLILTLVGVVVSYYITKWLEKKSKKKKKKK